MRPVTDHAEVAIDFPDKAYVGSFGHAASFACRTTAESVELKLLHAGREKRAVHLHLHWQLFADVLDEIAASLEGRADVVPESHRAAVADAISRFAGAFSASSGLRTQERASHG